METRSELFQATSRIFDRSREFNLFFLTSYNSLDQMLDDWAAHFLRSYKVSLILAL